MPTEETLLSEGFCETLRCIQHQLDDAIDAAVHVAQAGDVDAQAAGDRGADLRCIEHLALDLAAGHHILGQGIEHRLLAKVKAKGLHAAQEPTLPVAHRCELVDKALLPPVKAGPVVLLVDVCTPHYMRIL